MELYAGTRHYTVGSIDPAILLVALDRDKLQGTSSYEPRVC